VTRLHEGKADELLRSIVSGRYKPGTMLPKETDLVDEFGISRGTVREALRALEERGVITVKHGRGARVQPPGEWNVLDPVVARAMSTGRGSRQFLDELQLYRVVLESEVAVLAAERASDEQRADLRAAAAPDVRGLIAGASGNRPLAAALRALDAAVEPRLGPQELDACRRLAAAVADGDADAARAAVRALNGVD